MKLSIIIVNYNVKFFLEQCLYSVRKAVKNIDAEVFVVDNNSVDDSLQMVAEKFPEVIVIANKDNPGFSKANNQAIRVSKGEYVLLLNPDTVVEDDTFTKCIDFMDDHPDAGGLGAKMIDGKGQFLPESKRGLPTPAVAFYKIFGLSRLFPKSKKFSRYHLSYLDENETHKVEVLAGAFMLMRKETLDKVGLLDEDFFMYGEDIDLSYRIIKGGYNNYYFPDARIIHYKGESTKKSSVNYVFVFYNAMVIFAKKHFSQKNAKLFSFFINMAIYFRASLAIISRFIKRAIIPFLDFSLILIGMYFLKEYWEVNYHSRFGNYYPEAFMQYEVPAFILTWLGATWLSGGYDKQTGLKNIFQGISLGTIAILVVYALLPESLRFSRALTLLGAGWSLAVTVGTRLASDIFGLGSIKLRKNKEPRFVIIGEPKEAIRVRDLLYKTYLSPSFIGLISTDNSKPNMDFIGGMHQIREVVEIFKIDEIVFCSASISHQQIMDQMAGLQDLHIDYKIAPEDSLSIIGSNSINTSGDLYTVEIDSIDKVNNKRNKRLFDLISGVILLACSPFVLPFTKKPGGFIRNTIQVIFGKKTWVGYDNCDGVKLPKIRKGVISPACFLNKKDQVETIANLNLLYARDYKVSTDLSLVLKGIRLLGN